MKKTASTKLANDPLAGIPEGERKNMVMLSAMSHYLGHKVMDPRRLWEETKARRAREAAEKEKMAAERAQEHAAITRKLAIEALTPALDRLANCRDIVGAIEDNLESMSYLGPQEMAGFVKLALEDAGAKLEQSLCDLGLVCESEHGFFVGSLKSRGVKMEPIPEKEAEEANG